MTQKNRQDQLFAAAANFIGGLFKDGVAITASAAELNEGANAASSQSTVVLNAGGAVTQTATIQIKDADAVDIAAVHKLQVFMVTDAAGATPSAAGAFASAAPTTGALITALEADLNFDLVTDATGLAVFTFDNTGGAGAYTDRLAVVLPNGQLVISAALNVANA